MPSPRLALITGAAGFVGRRLVDALRDERPLRCLVREHEDLDAADGVEVVTGDLADRDGLAALLEGVDCAYYLVHSMEAAGDDDFAARDRALATNMADAARSAGSGDWSTSAASTRAAATRPTSTRATRSRRSSAASGASWSRCAPR